MGRYLHKKKGYLMANYSWKFFRSGGFDQACIDTGTDLLSLPDLDQKLWVALSCPTNNVAFATETLTRLDTGNDGHVRAADLIAGIEWLRLRLSDPRALEKGSDQLALSSISSETEEGKTLLAAARRVLIALGKPTAETIELADLADRNLIFGQSCFNGDGIITVASTDDEACKTLLNRLGDSYGYTIDRSGEPGLNEIALNQARADVNAYAQWQNTRPEQAETFDLPGLLSALPALANIRNKIDDYFIRCEVAAFDPRANATLNGDDETLAAISRADLSTPTATLLALPLSRPLAGKALALTQAINPAWREALNAFTLTVLTPLLGARDKLSSEEWAALKARLVVLSDWYAARPVSPLTEWSAAERDALQYATGDALCALMAEELALGAEFSAVDDVEKLLYFTRDLLRFSNNFVAFREFYSRRAGEQRATFLAGTLYIDGRSCDLCVKVSDSTKHAALASLSKLYLLYCDCTRGSEKMSIAAAVTDGEADQLMIGRNAVFYDREGNDWNATIVKIIDHPISLRQAFWSPYRKIGRMIGEQLQKFASSKAQSAEAQMQSAVLDGANKVMVPAAAGKPAVPTTAKPGSPPTAPAAFDVAKFAGIFAAVGLAVGAIGTAIATVFSSFLNLHWWQMPIAIAGIIAMISGPSMLLAFFKLRKRTLGPILDANGWAINSRALINIPFGASLTQMAKLPTGAERALTDPYAEKKRPYHLYAILTLIAIALALWLIKRVF